MILVDGGSTKQNWSVVNNGKLVGFTKGMSFFQTKKKSVMK